MRVLREKDFDKMAQKIVSDYLEREIPLDDGLAKVSEEAELGPDQIQNLVHTANTLAHLTLFEKKSGDKMVEFSPADPDIVLKKVYKHGQEMPESSEPCPESASPISQISDFFGDFPDLSKKIQEALGTETAPAVSLEGNDGATPHRKSMMIIKIRKVASELNNRRLTSALEYKEELDKLAAEFAKLYGPNYADFEKDALALRGDAAIPVLTDIRTCLRMPPEVPSFDKKASVVDDKTPEMQSLDKLIKLSESHQDCEKACEFLRQKVGGVL
jgi:hypothetical protein